MVNPPLSCTRGIYTENQILSPFDQPGPVTRSRSRSRNETLLTGTDDKTPHRLLFGPTDSNSSASSFDTTSSTRSDTSGDNQGREGTPITPPSDYGGDVKGLEAPPYAADSREVPTLLLPSRGFSGESSSDSNRPREVPRPSTPQPTEEDEGPWSIGSTSAVTHGLGVVYDESPTVRRVRTLNLKKLADAAKATKAAEAAGEVDEDERIAGISEALGALGLDSENNNTESTEEPEGIDEAVQEPKETDEAVVSGASHVPQPEQQQQTSFVAADSSFLSGEDGVSSFPDSETAVLPREVDEQLDVAITRTTRPPTPTSIPNNTTESALEDGLDATASSDVDRQADLNEGSGSTSVETITPPRDPQNEESRRFPEVKENAVAKKAAVKEAREKAAAVKKGAREKAEAAKKEAKEKEVAAKREAKEKEAAAKKEAKEKEAAAKKEAKEKNAAAKKEATANETTATIATGVEPTSTGETALSQKEPSANANSSTAGIGQSQSRAKRSSTKAQGEKFDSMLIFSPFYEEEFNTRARHDELFTILKYNDKAKGKQPSPPKCRGHVKIGMTKNTPRARISQWTKSCKLEITLVEDRENHRFFHFQLVEKLVQNELHSQRCKYTCLECQEDTNGVNHGEWYAISEELALATVQKWRRWLVKNRPYNTDGILRPIWNEKYKALLEETAQKTPLVDKDEWVEAWVQPLTINEAISYFWIYSIKTTKDTSLKFRTFLKLVLGLLTPIQRICEQGVDGLPSVGLAVFVLIAAYFILIYKNPLCAFLFVPCMYVLWLWVGC